jgi:hypothetical protein
VFLCWEGHRYCGLSLVVSANLCLDCATDRTREPKVQHLSVHSTKLVVRKFLGVRLWSILRETVCRDETAAFRLPPASPLRRSGVADVGNGISTALTDAWCSRGLGTIHALIYWLHQEIQS